MNTRLLTRRGKIQLGALLGLIGGALAIYNGIPWETKEHVKEVKTDLQNQIAREVDELQNQINRLTIDRRR